MDKKLLREKIRQEKRRLSQQELGEMSLAIVERVWADERVGTARTIMLYSPLADEVDVSPLLRRLYSEGRRVLLPKVVSDTEMTLHEYHGMESLRKGSFGIMEPVTPAIDSMEMPQIDVAIIPGMAFDGNGNRLGRGKGYYDRFLSRACVKYKIGVCFPFQKVESVPCEANDIRMDKVVS